MRAPQRWKNGLPLLLMVSLCATLLQPAPPSKADAAVAEFAIPTAGSNPQGIAEGPDGNLWFAELLGNKVGRITPAGAITEFPLPTAGGGPLNIVAGPDGNVWFTELYGNKIGRITPAGSITEFSIPTANSQPSGIALGPDGNGWFTEVAGKIGRITPAGVITEFPLRPGVGAITNIAAGPDGNGWFSEYYGNAIGRITPAGVITEFPLPPGSRNPDGIVAGPDGNLWFTEAAGKIGRITPAGAITEFPLPRGVDGVFSIAAGPDGNLWFTETGLDQIGRITPTGLVTMFALPTGDSNPEHIAAGPDDNLWFTEAGANQIGRLPPPPQPALTLLPEAAPADGKLRVDSDGWPAGAQVSVSMQPLGGDALSSVGGGTSDQRGHLAVVVDHLPALAAGPYRVYAECRTCAPPLASASAAFTITPAEQPRLPVDQRPADQRQASDLARLRQNSASAPDVRLRAGGTPRFAALSLPVPATVRADPLARASWFLGEYRGLLRLDDPAQELQLVRRSRDGQHLLFRQRHNGIPVFPAELAVHLDGNVVTGFNGGYAPAIALDATPRIGAEQAEALALALGGRGARVVGDTQLRYVNLGLLGFSDQTTHLAWKVSLIGGDTPTLYLDAISGALLFAQPGALDAFDLDLRTAVNQTDDNCWNTVATDVQWFDENGALPGLAPDADGNNAFTNISAVYNYWRNAPGIARDSFDGAGGQIRAFVHVGAGWSGAQFVPGCDNLEFGDSYPVLDVVGHEFTHGVVRKTVDLAYITETGALNESFADIFGYLVDPNDWTLGEDLPGGARRDLSDPPAHGQPDHMSQLYTLKAGQEPDCVKNDCGYVHTNSGIPNKAAYLIINGGVFSGRKITSIGRANAAKLFYGILRDHRLVANSTFKDLPYAAIESAKALGFSLSDICQVRNAYAAVGLGDGDADCDGKEDNADPNHDGDSVADAFDNCPLVANGSQDNLDNDGLGDACDPDVDNDGVNNTGDNCERAFNPTQADANGNHIGDACDDRDGDWIVDIYDNCPNAYNSHQENLDGDKQGDLCDPDVDGDGVPQDGDNSGVAGDNPCKSFQSQNCDDNSPLLKNPTQADRDGDGIGNASDLCSRTKSSDNGDPDRDGKGNPCDNDDDGDELLDDQDNCPLVANPDQSDIDNNGIGNLCDPTYFQEWWREQLEVQFRGAQPVVYPLPQPCLACGELAIQNPLEQVISLELSTGFYARIVDSDGFIVTQSLNSSPLQVLVFQPALASFANNDVVLPAPRQATGQRAAPDQTRYRLEVFPLPGADLTRSYALKAAVSERFSGSVQLPLVYK